MQGYNRIDTLVTIAKLYYEHHYSQNIIAKKLNLSRPYISKLLQEAREMGVVTITVNDPTQAESWLEREIRQRFALRKVIVAPRSVEEPIVSKVGAMCARYLSGIVSDDDVIGVSWGRTLHFCAQKLAQRHDLKGVTVVQVCGGMTNISRDIYASEIPLQFADAFSGTPFCMPLPAVLDSVALKEAVTADRNISRVLEIAKQCNIIVFTAGSFGQDCALARAGYLSQEDVARLKAKGAVGDICCHIVNEEGKLVDPELDKRTVGIELGEIAGMSFRICVAESNDKVKTICAALRGGYANVLVTDEDTANAILAHLDGTRSS